MFNSGKAHPGTLIRQSCRPSFEPPERMIDDVVGDIDERIQLAIDIARGK
jgi:hypothetical protein